MEAIFRSSILITPPIAKTRLQHNLPRPPPYRQELNQNIFLQSRYCILLERGQKCFAPKKKSLLNGGLWRGFRYSRKRSSCCSFFWISCALEQCNGHVQISLILTMNRDAHNVVNLS